MNWFFEILIKGLNSESNIHEKFYDKIIFTIKFNNLLINQATYFKKIMFFSKFYYKIVIYILFIKIVAFKWYIGAYLLLVIAYT
jgi:hypothetical protein